MRRIWKQIGSPRYEAVAPGRFRARTISPVARRPSLPPRHPKWRRPMPAGRFLRAAVPRAPRPRRHRGCGRVVRGPDHGARRDAHAGPRLLALLRDVDHRQPHDDRAAVGRAVLHDGVPRDPQQDLVHARLERRQRPDGRRPGAYLADIASLRAARRRRHPVVRRLERRPGRHRDRRLLRQRATSIAAAYEQLVTTYDVSRLDMDIEGRSLTKTDGIDRRNKAIKLAPGLGRPPTAGR